MATMSLFGQEGANAQSLQVQDLRPKGRLSTYCTIVSVRHKMRFVQNGLTRQEEEGIL